MRFNRWSPERGGVLWHGTTAMFDHFKGAEAYLTDDKGEAGGYAEGVVSSVAGKNGTPVVRKVTAKPGKVYDATDEVDGADDPDEAINAAIAKARAGRYRYVSFEHPTFEADQQRVLASLYPNEDLGFADKVNHYEPAEGVGKPGGESGPRGR